MTKQVQRRRGTAAQHTSFTGAEGEISVNTTNKSVHVHDGLTAGGIEAARADLDNVSSASVLSAAGLTATATELNYTDGVTSPIQTQLNSKAPINNATFTGTTVIPTADINGGTIDGVTIATSDITVGAGKTLDVSAGTLTLANDQISGDKVEGGTINAITINTLGSTTGNITTVNATTVDSTNVEVTNIKAKDGTASATIADSTGVMTIASSVLTTADINGGTIDGTVIGGSTPAAISGTTGTFSGNLAVDTDTLFVDAANNRVAIGATNAFNWKLRLLHQDADAIQLLNTVGAGNRINMADQNFQGEIEQNSGNLLFKTGGTTERLRIDSSGNVGIGTSSPATILDVVSSGNPTLTLRGSDAGYTSILKMQGAGGGGSVINATGATFQTLQFQINDVQRMILDPNGNVGIGTSSPAVKLHASQSYSAPTGGHDPNVYAIISNSGSADNFAGVQLSGGNNGGSFIHFGDTDDSNVGALAYFHNGDYMQFLVNAAERMRIDSSGNVGIGTSSPSSYPAAPELVVDTGTNGGITIKSGTSNYGGIFFADGTTGDEQFRGFVQYNHNYLGSTDSLLLGTSGTTRMTIDSSGNVGIGTTPSAWSAQARAIQLGNFTAFYQNASGLPEITFNSFQNASNVDTYRISANPATKYQLSDVHIWFTASSGTAGDPITYSERMRIDASGNLLVGKTAPSGELFGFEARQSGVAVVAANLDGPAAYFNRQNDNGQLIQLSRNNIIVGSIDVTTTATTYNTSSDYRLKEDVQPMVGATDRLMALKPVNFAWKADGSRVDGFLAHEAQEVVPEAVTGSKDAVDKDGKPEYQGIDQSKLVPLLTAALQEALTEIADLKARVAALEA
jgi:hypothetical protein